MKKEDMSCIDCAVKNCNKMDKTYPDFCLTTHMDEEVLNEAMECYNEDENRKVTIAAAEVEYENYCKHTRVEEIMDFAKKINAKKIGIATCVGLLKESRILADILRRHGFEVYGVGCKAGTQKKTSVGIPECCEGVGVNMCNPILQAKLLNKAKTDLNVVVGLCVGHDSLFYKYSEALTTTAVTKDRVLGHNPVAALYTADSYYSKLKKSVFFLEKKRIIGYSIRYDAFYRQRHTTIRKAGADAYEMSCAGGRQGRPAVAAVQEKLSQAVYQYPEGSFHFSGNDCQEYSLL